MLYAKEEAYGGLSKTVCLSGWKDRRCAGELEEGDLVKAAPIRVLLQNALLRAEEAYIDTAEIPPQTIWVNPGSGSGKQD